MGNLFKRSLSLLLALSISLSLFSFTGWAAETEEVQSEETVSAQAEAAVTETAETAETEDSQEVVVSDSRVEAAQSAPESEELLYDYMLHAAQEEMGVSEPAQTVSLEDLPLSGPSLILYRKVEASLPDIANGTAQSTSFTLTAGELGLSGKAYTKEELGVDSFSSSDGKLSDAAGYAYYTKVGLDLHRVIACLRLNHPYEMYWYGNQYGSSPVFGIQNDRLLQMNTFTLSLSVNPDFAPDGSPFTVDKDKAVAAAAAAQKAAEVVEANKDKSTRDKLVSYAAYICTQVNYNEIAAGMEGYYGNPWQMIYVFDGDPDTDVVCEGYAKAFQYLCDLSGIDCRLVSGTMGDSTRSGAHMWNLVTLEGRNYLADVTNSDSDSGFDGRLFLITPESGSLEAGYLCKGYSFIYDEDTRKAYTQAQLTLLPTNPSSETENPPASCTHVWGSWTVTKAATVMQAGSRTRTCSVCGARETQTVAKLTKVAAPVLAKVANVYGGIQVTWKPVEGAVYYQVYSKVGNGKWSSIGITNSTSFVWKLAAKYSSVKYTFTVKCLRGSDAASGAASGYDKVGKTITYYAAPIISKVQNVNGGVRLTWGAVKGISKYQLYYRNGKGGWKKLAAVSGTAYTCKKAVSGVQYSFTVRCLANNGKTLLSGYHSAGKSIRYVATPAWGSVVNSANNTMTVRWKAVKNVTGYQVQYSTNKAFQSGNKAVTVKGASKVAAVIKSLAKNRAYYVRVRSFQKAGGVITYSAWSAAKGVVIRK